MNAVDVARTLVEHAADALLVSSLGTAISALRRTSNDGPHFYFGSAMGPTAALIAAETRFSEVAQSLPHLAAARARPTEELASRLSTLPRPGLLEAVIADRTWPGCSPLVEPRRVRARFAARANGGSDGCGSWREGAVS
jgi:hypothetical protein